MKIVSWNINSVRLRLDSALRLASEVRADVLCLQETKCRDDQFPLKAFNKAGYSHAAIRGQPGYHGVAILSRLPLDDIEAISFCGEADCRHIAATVAGGIRIHNFYVPSGGDTPDPLENPKFDHKLRFLDEMAAWSGADRARTRAVLVGDLNVAPYEHDVWSHRQLLGVVSHTPAETARLGSVCTQGGWLDVARALAPPTEKIFTWWSYRSRDWRVSNRGRRLDHIWVSEDLGPAVTKAGRSAFQVHDDCRDWDKPSDHAPVSLDLRVRV